MTRVHQATTMSFRAIFIFIASMVALAFTPAHADAEAESFMNAILDEANPYLNAPTQQEKFDGIETLVDKYVDMRRVGRFTLGQYARRLTDDQDAAFQPLFRQYATTVYQKLLAQYADETFVVVGSIDRSERDIIVNTKIKDAPPGHPFADTVFHWRIYRARNGEMSVFDAGADNVWLALEQRSQFISVIANNGGPPSGVDALIAQLEDQTGQ